jgi:hypothetical protein
MSKQLVAILIFTVIAAALMVYFYVKIPATKVIAFKDLPSDIKINPLAVYYKLPDGTIDNITPGFVGTIKSGRYPGSLRYDYYVNILSDLEYEFVITLKNQPKSIKLANTFKFGDPPAFLTKSSF